MLNTEQSDKFRQNAGPRQSDELRQNTSPKQKIGGRIPNLDNLLTQAAHLAAEFQTSIQAAASLSFTMVAYIPAVLAV